MRSYWIKSLNEWAPNEPEFSCPDIDTAIDAIERVRKVNEELRAALDASLETIKYLDSMVCELEAELNKREVQAQ